MTINKAQGQSLRFASIDLRASCFSHGQFYVAVEELATKIINFYFPLHLKLEMLYIEKRYDYEEFTLQRKLYHFTFVINNFIYESF